MHYDLLNNEDIYILECRRIDRFRTLFLEIVKIDYLDYVCADICLTLDSSLIISCGKKISALIMNVEEVHDLAQYVLGISRMSVYHGTQLVYEYNKLEEISANIETMTVATEKYTVEREQTDESNKATPKITKSLALTDIAADLDASPEDIHSFLMERDGLLLDFKGMIIVPESTAAIAYEHYSLVRARQKMQERFTTGTALYDVKHSSTQASKSKTKSKKPSLTFKREFKIHGRNYKRTMENFLNAMFPDAPDLQEQALADIIAQNETGGAYFDKILRVGDYPDKRHARDLLYKAAAELSKKNDGSSDPKEETESIVEQLQD